MILVKIQLKLRLQGGRGAPSEGTRTSSVLPDLLSQASASPGTPSARDKSQSEEVCFRFYSIAFIQ